MAKLQIRAISIPENPDINENTPAANVGILAKVN